MSGRTARLLAKYRPHCPILCATSDAAVARQLQMYRGLHAVLVPPGSPTAEYKRAALRSAKAHGIVEAGDRVVAVQGAHTLPGQWGVTVTMSHVK